MDPAGSTPANHDGPKRAPTGRLNEVLDALIALRWDLKERIRDGAGLPSDVLQALQAVDWELGAAINAIRSKI